jgi:hypothetical protein
MNSEMPMLPERCGENFGSAIERAAENIDACILCGKPRALLGCFMADDPERYLPVKLKPGKTRALFYGLCDPCHEQPDKLARVEARLERDASRAKN